MTVLARWRGAHVIPAPPMTDRRDDFARLPVAETLEVARKALRSVGMRLAAGGQAGTPAYRTAKFLVYLAALLADQLAGHDQKRAELDALL